MIQRRFPHEQGCRPGNQLALQHPYVLNVRAHPYSWGGGRQHRSRAKLPLPHYHWKAVVRTVQDAIAAPDRPKPAQARTLAGWDF